MGLSMRARGNRWHVSRHIWRRPCPVARPRSRPRPSTPWPVVIAGAYGGATAKRSIWITQALPAIIALALVYAAHTSIISPS
ncbi:MAG: hypothetical protein DME08_09165 [Candidatus Rokuibacteriota bacterium]|nr:MAG: hypothetical protein DME08_09165 [Candidatus Rokubacteria bacterium]